MSVNRSKSEARIIPRRDDSRPKEPMNPFGIAKPRTLEEAEADNEGSEESMVMPLSSNGDSSGVGSGECDGVVKVHESVIASIVRKATCSVDGVVRLAGNTLVDNIAEIVGSKKMHDRAIAIEMGDGSVQLEVKVILAYGVEIPAVAAKVQEAVIDQICKITGMAVGKVNVVVMDLEDPPQEGL